MARRRRRDPATAPAPQKPFFTVGMFGQPGQGRTTLLNAIYHVLGAPIIDKDDRPGIVITAAPSTYATSEFWYIHAELRSVAHCFERLLGSDDPVLTLLAVSSPEGLTVEAKAQLALCLRLSLPLAAVFLNDAERVPPERLRVLRDEVEAALISHGASLAEIPIIAGSTLHALDGVESPLGAPAIHALLDALDAAARRFMAPVDGPFLMPVEDVFHIRGRGTVVVGHIERGSIQVGDTVEIAGLGDRLERSRHTTITGIEQLRRLVSEGKAGDNVGCLLHGISAGEVERGQTLLQPGSATVGTRFNAALLALDQAHTGKAPRSLPAGVPLSFMHHVAALVTIPGCLLLHDERSQLDPGQHGFAEIELLQTTLLERGFVFVVNDAPGRAGRLAVGRITEILEGPP